MFSGKTAYAGWPGYAPASTYARKTGAAPAANETGTAATERIVE